MSFPYTEEMMESVKKVEATRAARMAAEPRRMTAEEKDALLEQYHPDYNLSGFFLNTERKYNSPIPPNRRIRTGYFGNKSPDESGHDLSDDVC